MQEAAEVPGWGGRGKGGREKRGVLLLVLLVIFWF